MRHGRAKAARKTLSFFARQGVTPPFCVLVDGPFLVQAVVHNVPIIERMEKLLQYSRFTLQITRSTLEELQVLARHAKDDKGDVMAQARQWGLDECEILEENDIDKSVETTCETELGIPGQDIVKLVESQAHSYIVATQDETLLDVLRNSGQCPLLRLSRGVLLLEHPSKAAQNRAQYEEKKKYSHSAVHTSERELAKSAKQELRQQQQHTTTTTSSTRVKRKAKGPNPLSCKKKQSASSDESAHKRKRRRKKQQE
jgi:U3 small nucleolar RNA-associated protein 23